MALIEIISIVYIFLWRRDNLVRKNNIYEQKLRDYTKNIKINTHFNEEGIEINELMKEIILNNCNPIERKKLEF